MSDVIAKATEQLLKLVDEVHANYSDRYNPEGMEPKDDE